MKCTFFLWNSSFFNWVLFHIKETWLTTFWLASTNKSQILWIFINPCFWHQTSCWIIFLSKLFVEPWIHLEKDAKKPLHELGYHVQNHSFTSDICQCLVKKKQTKIKCKNIMICKKWACSSVNLPKLSHCASVCHVWFCIFYFVAEVNPLQPTLRIRFSYVVWSTGFASGAAKGLLYKSD